MPSSFENGVISLIKSALSGKAPVLPQGFDFERAYTLAKKQQIVPIIYYGALSLPELNQAPSQRDFLMTTASQTAFSEEQLSELSLIFSRFNEEKIDHVKLKGTALKGLYAYPEMRLMSDSDILIREEEHQRIKPIMLSLGYEMTYESDHELIYKKGRVIIELHKRLIPSYTEDFYEYFGEGWRIAKPVYDGACEYTFTCEDNFIYLFTHYAKHYRDGGVGIKFITDFYVYLTKNPQLDMDYIEKELDKMNILTFWKNTKKLIDVWFFDKESDEMVDFLTAKIFDSDTYGTYRTKLIAEGVRLSKSANGSRGIKRKKLLLTLFPRLSTMKKSYPVLEKCPFLLPIMWVVRGFDRIFVKKKKIKDAKQVIEDRVADDESILKYDAELNYVGLAYNFKSKV